MLSIIDSGGLSIFEVNARYLVNPVNCVGVMGAGLAKQFASKFPEMLHSYKEVCKRVELNPGAIHSYDYKEQGLGKCIVNVTTKKHWKEDSQLQYIDTAVINLDIFLKTRDKVEEIAIPAIGCGLGGLSWKLVRPRLEKIEQRNKDWLVYILEPKEFHNGTN